MNDCEGSQSDIFHECIVFASSPFNTGDLSTPKRNKDLFVDKRRSVRSCVVTVTIMVDFDNGNLRISDISKWNKTLRTNPGFRRTRHGDTEYSTGIAGTRGVRIGHVNEIILWPNEICSVVNRICGQTNSHQEVLSELFRCGPYWDPDLSKTVQDILHQLSKSGCKRKLDIVGPLLSPNPKMSAQTTTPPLMCPKTKRHCTWEGKGPPKSTWFAGEVVQMKSVGKRGKKTHDTGTHPSDVPVMMSLKRLFDWEVSL